MGFEAEAEQKRIPRLPLLSMPAMQSPERPGTVTPPLHKSAAVPFRWEQEPGKPRPCSALVAFSNTNDFLPKCLELPPRLLIPSPTTLLQGPYVSSNRFRSPSFRTTPNCYGSDLGNIVPTKGVGIKDYGWFGSWRKKAFRVKKREVTGGSHVFPSSNDKETTHMPNMKRSGSSSSLSSHGKSRVWTSLCEGLKQVVPWRSKKLKKDGSGHRL
ncbi:hypothetical protein RJT34_20550 [Clitoria ternatea]|uniref:Uncharacterized protein n=1 Tax=Clitoria ternatea TaxID=43366 RepID=A0AAN9P5X3_CLITE